MREGGDCSRPREDERENAREENTLDAAVIFAFIAFALTFAVDVDEGGGAVFFTVAGPVFRPARSRRSRGFSGGDRSESRVRHHIPRRVSR